MPARIRLLNKNGTLLIFACLLFALNILVQNPALGFVSGGLWFTGLLSRACAWESLGRDWVRRVFWGGLGSGSLFLLLNLGMYFLFDRYTGISAWIALSITTAIIFCIKTGRQASITPPPFLSRRLIRPLGREPHLVYLGVSICASASLLILWVAARSGDPIISPWNSFGIEPFLIFFIGLLFFWFGTIKTTDDLPVLAAPLIAFSALSVSAIVYAVGFGFDPFLHRAAEQALMTDGFILPKQLLYSGQYVLTVALSFLTAFPLKTIDIALLPVLSSMLLPAGVMIGLEDGWNLSQAKARRWWLFALIIPFMPLTFTAPFNITFLLFLLTAFLYPIVRTQKIPALILLLSWIAMMFIHPLVAVPVLLFLIAVRVTAHLTPTKKILASALASVLIGLSVPCLFFFYQWQKGRLPSLETFWTGQEHFVTLFLSPFWDPYPFIPWWLHALYELHYWLPMIVALVGVISLLVIKRVREQHGQHFLFAFGLLMSIYLSRTLFVFDGIIAHEQGEFALRLLHSLYVFFLPPVILLVGSGLRSSITKKSTIEDLTPHSVLAGTTVIALVTISLFFSYPQYNLKVPFFSPSVAQSDVELVHEIETHSKNEPYLVLSGQILSAAAIQEFGFRESIKVEEQQLLWYALPTGGYLYGKYLEVIHQPIRREQFDALQQQTGVEHIYLVLNNAWGLPLEKYEVLDKIADEIIRNPLNTVYIFTY